MSNFHRQLQVGKVGESQIAHWFMSRGYAVLPVYEKETGDYKGPVLYTAGNEQRVAPDMLVFKKDRTLWIEAKHKSAFTWHRITNRWVTGIDSHHFNDYLAIAKLSEIPVWILFLHRVGVAKDTPEGKVSPVGLFGGEIEFLKENINHEHDNWGKHGMVYWAHDVLKKIAPLEHFEERSAIMEYDGGLDRIDADSNALISSV
jgi:hypothetical protein